MFLNLAAPDAPSAPTATSGPRAELPPLDVDTPEVSAAADAACPGLLGGLPLTLGGSPARPVRSAAPYAAAWGEPPIVLRCGVPRPATLREDSSLFGLNGVAWLSEPGPDATVWTAVDRSVYVEVSVPTAQDGDLVAVIAEVVADRLPPLTGPGASASPTPTR